MKTIAIIQARMGSTRLPKKVLTDICGRPMLWHIVNRVKQSKALDKVIVATSEEKEDDEIANFAQAYQISYYRGSQVNVLDRFWKCANQYNADIIVRLTGDNALVDSEIIDEALLLFKDHTELDYMYYREGLPIGMAVEVFKFSALTKAYLEASNIECLEHVTPYLYRNKEKFCSLRVPNLGRDHSNLRWTMDTEADKKLILQIYGVLYQEDKFFHYQDILAEYEKHKEWLAINNKVIQNKVEYQGETELTK